jgi:excisionase family DNA binding protein
MERRWISPKECAKYLGIHEKTCYRLLGTEIPASKIGGRRLVDLKDLEAILERRKIGGTKING